MDSSNDFVIENGVLKEYTGPGGDVTIPEGVTEIGESAFSDCSSLLSVTIPDGVRGIGEEAFINCSSLVSVTIPDTVTTIGDAAFYGCKGLADENGYVCLNGHLFNYYGSEHEITIPEGVTKIEEHAFYDCSSLASVTIPDTVTKIGDNAFSFCSSLVSVTISEGVTEIGECAFGYCSSLVSVTIPEGVTEIGECAFEYCSSLTSVTIPDSVKKIGECAFRDCYSLASVTIPDTVTTIGDAAFLGCEGLADENGYVCLNGCLYTYCGSEREITIPESVTEIGYGAFDRCENLAVVKMPHTVQYVGDQALCSAAILFMSVSSLQNMKSLPGGKVIILSLEKDGRVKERFVTSKQDVSTDEHALYALEIIKGGKLSYEKYDDYILNGSKKFKLNASGKLRAVLYRFQYPVELSDAMREEYAAFAKKNLKKLIAVAEEDREPELVKALLQSGAVDDSNKKAAAKLLQTSAVPEIAALAAGLDSLIREKAAAPERVEANPAEAKASSPLEQEYLARFEKLGGENQLRKIGVLPAQLPQVKLRESEECAPSSLVAYLLLAYASQYGNTKNYHFTIDPEADAAAALLDRASLSDGLTALFDWVNAVEHIQVVPACCRYCDAKGVSHLIATFRKWDKWSEFGQRGRNAEYIGFDAMVLNDTREAVMFVDKYNRLSDYAAIRGTDADTIRDTVLADFGLDADGKKVYDLGSKTVVAAVSKELTLELFDTAANKVVKSIPKKGTDPELAAAAAAHFSDMKKNIKKVVKSRNDLLFTWFLDGTTRPAAAWKASYLGNPLLHRVAELVVWKQDQQTFILTADGVIDCFGSDYTIRDDVPIAVAHPIEMTPGCVLAWQRYFTSNALKQPFAQMWEPAIEPDTVREDRYMGCEVPLYKLKNQEKHGIGTTDGYYSDDAFSVYMDDCNLEVTQKEWTRHQKSWEMSADDLLVLGKFRFKRFTRKTNHIIAYFDQLTVNGRILRDDVTIADDLDQFTLAQLTGFIALASENNCTNVLALLMEYKNANYADFDPMAEFTLE